jgi:hypothetical protein
VSKRGVVPAGFDEALAHAKKFLSATPKPAPNVVNMTVLPPGSDASLLSDQPLTKGGCTSRWLTFNPNLYFTTRL